MELHKNYISMGTKTLVPELMCPPFAYLVKDSYKSTGGIWATYETSQIFTNPWIMHLKYHHSVFYEKYSNKAVKIVLKDDAKIYLIDNNQSLHQLQAKYPVISDVKNTPNKLIDYHSLSKDYDGIYIIRDLIHSNEDLKSWAVESLVLFNLNCIQSIQPLGLSAYEDAYGDYDIEITSKGEVQSIKNKNDNYVELLEKYNELYIKSIQKQGIEKKKFQNYWDFNKELYKMTYICFSENYSTLEQILNLLNKEILETPINIDRYSYPVALQLLDKNYEYINDIYKRNLKR